MINLALQQERLVTTVKGYMNIYRSGYYHRKGKPKAFDRHAGDIYPTVAAALEDIFEEGKNCSAHQRGRD